MRTNKRQRAILFALALFALLNSDPAARAQATKPAIHSLVRVGMTVSDMDRSLKFYKEVLDFQVTSDREVAGETYEHLLGVFGMRARIVNLTLAKMWGT